MRRILHVTDCYSTGVGRAIDTVVSLTPEHEHHLLWAGEDDPSGVGFASTRPLPRGLPQRVRAVRESVAQTGSEIVHAHSSRAGVYARLTGLDARVLYQPHAYKLLDPALPSPARAAVALVERALGPRTDTVVVLSEEERALAARLTPAAAHVLVPNVPTLARPAPVVTDPGRTGPPPRTVVMSGRVSAQKDPEYLVAVATRLRELDPGVSVRWLGSPDDARLAARLRAAGVEVTGWLQADELATALRDAGVYLHSAAYEGFPLSVLDAAACGLPVLVRDISAFAGTPLVRVAGPEDATTRVLEVLRGGEVWQAAVAGGRDLLASMDPAVQRARLTDLYG